jgi:KDO2-lipid IV(A) lauroyltransferase
MPDDDTPARLRIHYSWASLAFAAAFRGLGVRRSTIRGNLARSFPELDDRHRAEIELEFVRRQAEFAAELVHARRIGEDELRQRVEVVDHGLLANAAPPRPLILAGAHHGNFEWLLLRLSLELGERLLALYKPLRNPRADAAVRSLRSRFGARIVPAKSILQELARFRDAAGIGIIADQVPRTSPEKHWVQFLGQDTPFYMGPELLARALRSRLVFLRMDRLARGRYRLELRALNEPGERLPNGELTERYARELERWIREDPAGWWWSHKRWKLTRASTPGASPASRSSESRTAP